MCDLLGARRPARWSRRRLGARIDEARCLSLRLFQFSRQALELREAIWQEVPHDVDEVLPHQPLRPSDEQGCGVTRFVALEVAAHEIEGSQRVVATPDLPRAEPGPPSAASPVFLARRGFPGTHPIRAAQRGITGLDDAV